MENINSLIKLLISSWALGTDLGDDRDILICVLGSDLENRRSECQRPERQNC